ncbi:MAG: TIR domain-containing protein [Xanthobacteraceae bacterium]
MPKLLISYRRLDSDAMAGRIRDNLAAYYGNDAVFIDVDNIPFGKDFREHIREVFADHDLLIAVVGQKWVGPRKGGRTRIQEETDPVRVEIEMALQRNMPIVPVLVNGARMPKPQDLPDSLKAFSFRNAADVDSGRDFRQHMDRLIRSIDNILGLKPRVPGKARQGAKATLWLGSALMLVLVVLAVVALIGAFGVDGLRRSFSNAASQGAPVAADTVVDFSAAPVGKDPVAARPYLHQYGISVVDLVPADSEIVLVNNRGLYEGAGVLPTTSQIFLTQSNTGNVPASYTLTFAKPVEHVTFTRPTLYADTSSGVTHPAWKATALGPNNEELASQSETLLRTFKTVSARTFTLESVTFDGITAVRFDSDPRLNGKPFAAFSALLIERLTFGGAQ